MTTKTKPNKAEGKAPQFHDDLKIRNIEARTTAAGDWVSGTVRGHQFQALVFPEPAENPSYEISSGISKLWVQEIETGRTVFNWDRGLDISPLTTEAKEIVDLLCSRIVVWDRSKSS